MTASIIIEKYHHELTKSQLLFLVWLYDKYPDGVMRKNINYPHMNSSYMQKSTIPELLRVGALKTQGLGTNYSKVVPCL